MITKTITSEQRKKIDLLYWSPEERALGVHNLVDNYLKRLKTRGESVPSELDMLCYHIESLARLSIAIGDEALSNFAKGAILWLYEYHYNGAEKIYGEPDKR